MKLGSSVKPAKHMRIFPNKCLVILFVSKLFTIMHNNKNFFSLTSTRTVDKNNYNQQFNTKFKSKSYSNHKQKS